MDWDYLGERQGVGYWHYLTGKTTYVIAKEGETYMAFYFREIGDSNYLLHDGIDCRTNPFTSFLEAERACGNKLRALRGV